ncbi:MAG: ABC transporter permease [Bacteroidota bacterium]|jgi:ABC-2 type transport system permease protein
MFKFFSACRKESLILVRDLAGLIMLFLMPMIMVTILALVQEQGWSSLSRDPSIPVLLVDEDQDTLGAKIQEGLKGSNVFKIYTSIDGKPVNREIAKQKIAKGEYNIGVIIPKGSTGIIRHKVQVMVTQIVSGIMMPVDNPFLDIKVNDSINILIYFDPGIKGTFKYAFMSTMKEYSMFIESSMIFSSFNTELRKMFPQYRPPKMDYRESVFFTEIFPGGKDEKAIPSTTQHNVPAWALFAMFFIVIPMTGSMIKERDEGSMIRINTMPVSYFTIFMAKVSVYAVVCVIQFILMMLAGRYVLPLANIPSLTVGSNYMGILLMMVVSSLAALGFAIAVGTIARTHQQAAAFGVVSVVVLTALGGLWVPVYLMPEAMRSLALWSPLNWAHVGFIDLFLRQATIADILPQVFKLLCFFVITISIALLYRRVKSPLNN